MDPGDQLLLSELPHADFSKGGVYLFGASNVVSVTLEHRTSTEQYVHNFAVQSTNPEMLFQLVQFLVEHEGLLMAGGDRNMFIIGESYQHAGIDYGVRNNGKYFSALLARHGVYSGSKDGGIVMRVSPLVRLLIAERVHIGGFINALCPDIDSWNMHFRSDIPVRRHDPVAYHANLTELMGDEWESKLSTQAAYFGQLLDYVRARGASVVVVLLPLGSWQQDLPYGRRWNEEIVGLCKSKQIELRDWSQMLDDDDFRG